MIKTKRIYGLESVHLNDSTKSKIDGFQLEGLRQILKMHTTFIKRANSNKEVPEGECTYTVRWWSSPNHPYKCVCYENQSRKIVREIITAPMNEPIRNVCANDRLKLIEHPFKRVGTPRNNWWLTALTNFWNHPNEELLPGYRYVGLDINNNEHIQILFDHS